MNGLLLMILLSLGGISARSIQGREQLDPGKRLLLDDVAMNGDDWFSGGRNPGKRSSGANPEKRCTNLFSNGCSNGNGSGLMGDEDAAGQVGKRESALQDPELYKFLEYLYYNRKMMNGNFGRLGDGIPNERLY